MQSIIKNDLNDPDGPRPVTAEQKAAQKAALKEAETKLRPLVEARADNLFHSLDKNNDKKISLSEWLLGAKTDPVMGKWMQLLGDTAPDGSIDSVVDRKKMTEFAQMSARLSIADDPNDSNTHKNNNDHTNSNHINNNNNNNADLNDQEIVVRVPRRTITLEDDFAGLFCLDSSSGPSIAAVLPEDSNPSFSTN